MNRYPFVIEKPTLLLDERRAKANITQMVEKAQSNGVRLRPHFKTHQSVTIGEWFREQGIETITVSSLDMALYFAEAGWQDITVAFPVNPLEAEKINQLAGSVALNVLVDHPEPLKLLDQKLRESVQVWIKIDAGYGRVGIPWNDSNKLQTVLKILDDCNRLHFQGLLTHFGQTYHAQSPVEVRQIYHQALEHFLQAAENCRKAGYQNFELSLGDTPSCSLATEFPQIDEIRPGNFVFYDLTQEHIGSCSDHQLAVAVACPVVGIYPERKQIALYGGAVHFSKEGLKRTDGSTIYGVLAVQEDDGWHKQEEHGVLISLSQEHGIMTVSERILKQIRIGDVVAIFPVHSCLTANLYKSYRTLEGREIQRFQSLV